MITCASSKNLMPHAICARVRPSACPLDSRKGNAELISVNPVVIEQGRGPIHVWIGVEELTLIELFPFIASGKAFLESSIFLVKLMLLLLVGGI